MFESGQQSNTEPAEMPLLGRVVAAISIRGKSRERVKGGNLLAQPCSIRKPAAATVTFGEIVAPSGFGPSRLRSHRGPA